MISKNLIGIILAFVVIYAFVGFELSAPPLETSADTVESMYFPNKEPPENFVLLQGITIKNNFRFSKSYKSELPLVCFYSSSTKETAFDFQTLFSKTSNQEYYEVYDGRVEVPPKGETILYLRTTMDDVYSHQYSGYGREDVLKDYYRQFDQLLIFEDKPHAYSGCGNLTQEDIENAEKISLKFESNEALGPQTTPEIVVIEN